LLDFYGTAWVTDFGLAKVLGQEGLTQTGDLVGTLRYMPPERFRGLADQRGDVYALGLTLYELLALKPAFDESDRAQLIRRVTEEEPPRLTRDDASIPRDLATIVHKSMAREPADRYATARGLADDLRRFLDDRPIVARRPSLLDRGLKLSRRYRSAVIAGAIGLVVAQAILAGSLGWIVRDRAARSELTEREVNRALLEAATFQARAKWPEALEAVKRAEGFLAVGGSEQLRRHVVARRGDVDMALRREGNRLPRPIKGTEGASEKTGLGCRVFIGVP
jgi:eukaryotic-like serine/threonine-protein kinase